MKLGRLAALLGCLLICGATFGQGCSLCKDGVAAAPEKVRQGFRRAIPVLAVPAAGLFLAMLMVGWWGGADEK